MESTNKVFKIKDFINEILLHREAKREKEREGKEFYDWFVFCKDFFRPHGPRLTRDELLSNHYGRGFINITSQMYRRHLEEKGKKDFRALNPPINEDLIYTID